MYFDREYTNRQQTHSIDELKHEQNAILTGNETEVYTDNWNKTKPGDRARSFADFGAEYEQKRLSISVTPVTTNFTNATLLYETTAVITAFFYEVFQNCEDFYEIQYI